MNPASPVMTTRSAMCLMSPDPNALPALPQFTSVGWGRGTRNCQPAARKSACWSLISSKKFQASTRSTSGFSEVIASVPRSEEHTSELQSLMRISYAVFGLKNKKIETNKLQPKYNYKIDNTKE